MTTREIINITDEFKPNSYSEEDKLHWISTVDGLFYKTVLSKYLPKEGETNVTEFKPYENSVDLDRETLIPEPMAREIYPYFLMAKIDLLNHEINHYNNNITMYNDMYQEYVNSYVSTHARRQTVNLSLL